MNKVNIGIIGFGVMGHAHYQYLKEGQVNGAAVTAIFDINENILAEKDENVTYFSNIDSFFSSHLFDAVLIATPHYLHPSYAIKSLALGYHVLLEKPAGVYTKEVRLMNETALTSGLVFSMMFNQRMNPIYQKAKEIVSSGELGELKRTIWIITDWYRPQSYYDAGGWRATWKGEGGGVLLNQDPHQLDLWQWICGMPVSIQAFCYFGKHHDIEVEDDVTAFVEFENGATGVFITSTGETPGTNRLEISGDKGQLVIENNSIKFRKLSISERQFNLEFKGGFGQPDCTDTNIPVKTENPLHKGITQNFVNSILFQEALIAPGIEGVNSLTLSNAMLLSTWENKKIFLPLDEDCFLKHLNEKIENSSYIKKLRVVKLDTSGTY